MRTAQHQVRADNPPDIDELSSRLTALASRIDTLNSSRRGATAKPAAAKPVVTKPDAALPVPDKRLWPRVPVPGEVPATDIKAHVAAQAAQAAQIRAQEQRIAELTATRDRQAQELREACEHIERQALSIKTLRDADGSQDAEIAELTRRLMQAEADNVELESNLASALREANHASVRLNAHEGALSDRATDLVHAQELIEDLRTELTAAQVSVSAQVAATEERLQRRYESERNLHIDNTRRHLADIQKLLANRDRRIVELEQDKAALGDEVATLVAQLDDGRTELLAAAEALTAKNSHIAFLDTVIKVARDNAEATLKELVAEFDREREELAAKERAAVALRHEMAQLLPKLLERRAAA